MKNDKKPKIRFKGFDDDWEQRKLSEVVKEIKRTDETSSAPVMMITAENGFINQSERYSTNNAGQSLKKYILLEKGELAYNHGASKLRSFGSCFSLTTEEKARIPFVYHCFSSGSENAEFMSIELNGKAVESQLRRIVSSGARMDGLLNISFQEYTSIPILLPEKAEQDKIADYFCSLDHLITLHQRKCDKLQKIKKSMLEKMFPQNESKKPEIRFKGLNVDWEQRKLGDEAIEMMAGGDIDKEKVVEDGKYPIYANALTNDGIVGYYNDYFRVKAPAVTVTGRGEVGHAQARMTDFTPVVRLLAIRSNHDCYFLENAINNHKVIVESTGVPQLTVPQLASYNIFFPSKIEEEVKIGEYFNNLDNLITLHQG